MNTIKLFIVCLIAISINLSAQSDSENEHWSINLRCVTVSNSDDIFYYATFTSKHYPRVLSISKQLGDSSSIYIKDRFTDGQQIEYCFILNKVISTDLQSAIDRGEYLKLSPSLYLKKRDIDPKSKMDKLEFIARALMIKAIADYINNHSDALRSGGSIPSNVQEWITVALSPEAIADYGVVFANPHPFKLELTAAARDKQHFWVTLSLTNTAKQDYYICLRGLPFEDNNRLMANRFYIYHNGQRVPYLGPMFKRSSITADEMQLIKAGEHMTMTFDLYPFYRVNQPGQYTLMVNGTFFHYSLNKRVDDKEDLILYQMMSNPITVKTQ